MQENYPSYVCQSGRKLKSIIVLQSICYQANAFYKARSNVTYMTVK